MAKIAVVGGGPMGLATAYHLLKLGHEVSLFEADNRLGGMTASFIFDGIKIERYYHFICKADQPLFELLAELGIADQLRWTETRMGYFHRGQTQDWGEPFALLKFPGLDLISKIRYGLLAFTSTKRSNWQKLDGVDAVTWLKGWVGERAYEVFVATTVRVEVSSFHTEPFRCVDLVAAEAYRDIQEESSAGRTGLSRGRFRHFSGCNCRKNHLLGRGSLS